MDMDIDKLSTKSNSKNGTGRPKDYCTHIKPQFDSHKWCFSCRTTGKCKVLSDACARGEPCLVCEGFTVEQKQALQNPKRPYKGKVSSGRIYSYLPIIASLYGTIFI